MMFMFVWSCIGLVLFWWHASTHKYNKNNLKSELLIVLLAGPIVVLLFAVIGIKQLSKGHK
jgi:hypothetical protein